MKVAFAGAFAARIAETVRARLPLPCDVIVGDETSIIQQLGDVEVLVSMGFATRMAEAAPRLRLMQVPGAGLNASTALRCDRKRCWPMPMATRPASPNTSAAR